MKAYKRDDHTSRKCGGVKVKSDVAMGRFGLLEENH